MGWHSNWDSWLTLGLMVAGVLVATAYWRRRPTPQDRERQRRSLLTQHGRLASGKIVDIFPAPPAQTYQSHRLAGPLPGEDMIAVYKYEIAGVEYESSQSISPAEATIFLPGTTVVIRYDARNPGNCILTASTRTGSSPASS